MTTTLLLLGAGGDLTSRYLLPALARLHASGRAPEDLVVHGVDRAELDDEGFRQRGAAALEDRAADLPADLRGAFLDHLRYTRADVTSAEDLRPLVQDPGGAPVVYLALPHTLVEDTVRALTDAGLPEGSRVVVEKPFGTDLAEARELNALLRSLLPEESIFRVDHFLAKQTVLNVLGLRFANRVFEPVWNANHVERVDIVFDETLGLEGRSSYYDRAGALRDMLQNHLLQLLALVAMEPPVSVAERDLRDRKVDVLRAVRSLSPQEVVDGSVRARYTAGRVGDRDLPSYVDEEGVDPERGTETFAEVRLFVDTWRWSGVPFTLRSGKALGDQRREIAVTFRPVPHLVFGPDEPTPANVLRMRLDPDSIALGVNLNGSGDPFDLSRAVLDADFPPTELPAYAQLLAGVLEGDPTLSIRGDEAEESWRIVEPVLAAWADGLVPLQEYPAGSAGPEESQAERGVPGADGPG